MLTNYKKNKIATTPFTSVAGLNIFKNIKVIYTEYFIYLHETFGFKKPIKILHGVFFTHKLYLAKSLTQALEERKSIKQKLENDSSLSFYDKIILEAKSTELKLKINSCYGYSLCKENSMDSPYVIDVLKNTKAFIKQISRANSNQLVTEAREFDSNHWLVTKKCIRTTECNTTPLVAVGASILGISKVILLENVLFLLKYLDPRLAEPLYFDTDSIFLGLHYANLEDNVLESLKKEFQSKKNNYIDSSDRLSGFLVLEKTNTQGEFYGEKMYLLSNENSFHLGLKGIPKHAAKELIENKKLLYSTKEMAVTYTSLKRKINQPIIIQKTAKRFKKCIIPSKRLFVNCHSITY